MTHQWDTMTDCCKKCGQTHMYVVDEIIECAGADNVIAVTHLIYRKRFAELLAESLTI